MKRSLQRQSHAQCRFIVIMEIECERDADMRARATRVLMKFMKSAKLQEYFVDGGEFVSPAPGPGHVPRYIVLPTLWVKKITKVTDCYKNLRNIVF